MDSYLSFLLNYIGDIYGEAATHIVKYFGNLSLPDQKITNVFMVRKLQAEPLPHGLKSMAKWAVAEIMNESCSQRTMLTRLHALAEIANGHHQLSGGVKDAYAMR